MIGLNVGWRQAKARIGGSKIYIVSVKHETTQTVLDTISKNDLGRGNGIVASSFQHATRKITDK